MDPDAFPYDGFDRPSIPYPISLRDRELVITQVLLSPFAMGRHDRWVEAMTDRRHHGAMATAALVVAAALAVRYL